MWLIEVNVVIVATFDNRLIMLNNFAFVGILDIQLFDKDSIFAGRNSKQTQLEQEQLAL